MTDPQNDDLNARPWIGIVLILVLFAVVIFGIFLYVLSDSRGKAVSSELNCMEQINVSREREEVLAEAIKTVAYQADVLTEAVLNK